MSKVAGLVNLFNVTSGKQSIDGLLYQCRVDEIAPQGAMITIKYE